MYSEETDLCHRLQRAGWQIVYVPEAVVVHYEGRSSSQVAAARDIHFFTSQIRYQAKYFGPQWANLLRGTALWNYRIQLLLERAKWQVGHKRELRAQRIAAYREVLASRLQAEEAEPATKKSV